MSRRPLVCIAPICSTERMITVIADLQLDIHDAVCYNQTIMQCVILRNKQRRV